MESMHRLPLTLHFLPFAPEARRQATRRSPFPLEGPQLKLVLGRLGLLLVLVVVLLLLIIVRRDSRSQRCAIHGRSVE